MSFVGIVCGLQSEARAIEKAGKGLPIRIAVSGADTARALKEARKLARGGARGLLSAGVAGALTDGLAPGDLLIADAVVMADGTRYEADGRWLATLGHKDRHAVLAGAGEVLATVEDKIALARATGASAVDMESHVTAMAADEAAIPFAAIRTIADAVDMIMPPLALEAIDEKGHTRMGATLFGMIKSPGQVPGLMALGRVSAKAHQGLEEGLTRLLPASCRAVDL